MGETHCDTAIHEKSLETAPSAIVDNTPQSMKERLKTATISEILEEGLEKLLRWFIFWESDDKQLGIILQIMHHAFIYGLIMWYLYLHTLSNSYVQFVLMWFIILLIWLQHLFCGVCLFFNVEQKLIGDHPNIIDNILRLFRITPNENVGNGILLIISSLITAMVTCELLSRTIVGIAHWL